MDSVSLVWHTEQRKISDLIPFDGNPRQLTEKQVADLKKSVERFNIVEIPAINLNNKILAGHQRLKILQVLGRGEEVIDVRVPNRELTPEEEKEYLIRSNKNTGEWDWDALANFGSDDLMEWGFDAEELAKNFEIDTEEEKNEVPETPVEARAQRGQIFTLGKHRVMCGDSTNEADVGALMGEHRASMVFTDPPYGVDYEKKAVEILGRKDRAVVTGDDMGKDVLETVVFAAFQNIEHLLADGGKYYVCSPQGGELGLMMMMMMMKAGIECRHMIVWKKDSPVFSMGRLDYDYQHEPILYGWKGSHRHYANGEFKTSIWEVKRPRVSKLHPTMKPVELIINAIQNSTLQNEFVADLFLGSGSTLIACEKTGRLCFGMEIDPKYVDVIIKRYCNETGADLEGIYARATNTGDTGSAAGSQETQAPA